MPYESYALAAGYNVALVSLVNIEQIVPPGGRAFAAPKSQPLYDNGQVKYRLDGSIFAGGFPSVVWEFGFMSYVQWNYLSTTYCNGYLSGPVTIYTNLNGSSTYTRMNAVMRLLKPKEMQSEFWYKRVQVTFARLTTPS